MGNFWLKIKVWTKGITVAIVSIYALLFVYNNSAEANVWWWFNRSFKSSTVVLILIAFLAGVVGAVMVRTTFTTLRQIKDLRSRSRSDRIERELADMKDKAARLQTKPASTPSDYAPPSEPV
jgi:uncharacterized integral membrane protein